MRNAGRVGLVLLVLILLFQLSVISVAAENDADGTASESETEETTATESLSFIEKIADFFSNIEQMANNFLGSFGIHVTPLRDGGFSYANDSSELNSVISKLYYITYPIGFAIMLIAWGIGVAKSSISCSLDIKNSGSIIRELLSLVIGLTAIACAPYILSSLTGISAQLCRMLAGDIWDSLETVNGIANFSLKDYLTGSTANSLAFGGIVHLFIGIIFMLNILWIACLQVLSPLFVAFFASNTSRKLAMNFVKEYFKALLVPSVTIIYFRLALTMMDEFVLFGLIGSLVLAISTLGIAGKKLDKLIS